MKNVLSSLLVGFLAFGLLGCEKDEMDNEALEILYRTYKDGAISECMLEGQLVYTASQNRVDSPLEVYNQQGEQIASCNYAWGQVDAACDQLRGCEVVYRVEDHISGNPPIDKYGLGR